MKFPKMRPQGARRLSVPDLAGGLNLRDGVSEVLDNQLTQAKNVWWQDGVLKTRPGIYIDENQKVENGWYQSDVEIKAYPHIRIDTPNGINILEVAKCVDEDVMQLQFFWVGTERSGNMIGSIGLKNGAFCVTEKDGTIYIYTQYDGIYKWEYTKSMPILKVDEKEIYVPTIATNCRSGSYTTGGETPEKLLLQSTVVGTFNLLGSRAKFYYSTVNLDLLDKSDANSSHTMWYEVPYLGASRQLIPTLLEVNITQPNGSVVTHTATIPDGAAATASEYYEDGYNQGDGLKMKVLCNGENAQIGFFEKSNDKQAASVKATDYILNNLEVIIPVKLTDEDRERVFGCTQCEWFGGGTEGISGGTRLFFGGNSKPENQNLVVWSDLNNPLYVPMDNDFRVGEASSAVTGFGKQADMLVIFKSNGSGIYYTKYQQNTDITGEDFINQNQIDYASASVYFPLVQINPNVGCSHPDTIQLCRNRLVWFGDNGNVYTLVNENQYNERSIFCVSDMVVRDLKRNIKVNATACDWEGYYCLMCGNKLYLMDYNCYGYTHVASYSKTEDANIRIPWYIWEFPISGDIFAINDVMMFSDYNEGNNEETCCYLYYKLTQSPPSVDKVYYFNKDKVKMEIMEYPIETLLRTKFFTFGEPNNRKSVDKINLQLGNNGGEPITVKVITDQSEEEHDIYLSGNETEAYTPGYIDSKAIFPTARNFLRIGLELSSEGVVAVDGMEIKYRSLGGGR